MRDWSANFYPGTKLAITEYNWGGLDDINGSLAQADILGIFGRERLDLDGREDDRLRPAALEEPRERLRKIARPREHHTAAGEAHGGRGRIASAPWARSDCAARAPTSSGSVPPACARSTRRPSAEATSARSSRRPPAMTA